jgi:hypothetical protein
MKKPEGISDLRKRMANDIAAILSGVMAITSAALAVQPGELSVSGAMAGALLVGLVAMMTRLLNDQTKKRAELGRRLRWIEWGGILEVSAMALVYPALTTLVVLLGPVPSTVGVGRRGLARSSTLASQLFSPPRSSPATWWTGGSGPRAARDCHGPRSSSCLRSSKSWPNQIRADQARPYLRYRSDFGYTGEATGPCRFFAPAP